MKMSSSESRLQVSIAQAILFTQPEASANEKLGCGQTDPIQNYRKRRLNYGKESTSKEESGPRKEGCTEEGCSEEKSLQEVADDFGQQVNVRSMCRDKRTRPAINTKFDGEIGRV